MTIPRTFLDHHLSSNKKALFPSLLLVLTLISATGADAAQRSPSAADKPQGQDGQAADNSRSEPLTFVQITDVHLFDEGKKRDSRAEYDRDQQDNRDALRWAVEQINHLVSHGRSINFVVFTGDFGLELVDRTDADLCAGSKEDNDKEKKILDKYRRQGWPRFVSMRDAANEVAHEFSRLHISTIYVLPGNNDLAGEKPCDLGRYTKFVQQVAGAMSKNSAQIVDLIDQSTPPNTPPEREGFRLIGLNSASFKDKDNDASVQIPRLGQTIAANSPSTLSLIFTHIPDLEDPYTHEPSWFNGDKDHNPAIDRALWNQIAMRQNVAAIFAGHFHSAERLLYAAPGQAIKSPSDEDVADKTWVAPPLAIKAQDDKLETARGFLLVQLQKSVSTVTTPGTPGSTATVARVAISATPFWYEGPHPAVCWCYVLPVLSVLAVLAFLIWGISAYVAARAQYPGFVRETYPTLLTVIGLAGIAFGIWIIMKFMISDLGLPEMYWAGPIFGTIGGIFGALGEGNIFALAWYEETTKVRAGILGDVMSGFGGAIAVIFVTERALNLQSGNPDSLLWLMSVSFVAGVAGRKLVQLAIDKVLNKQALQRRVEKMENATASVDDGKPGAS